MARHTGPVCKQCRRERMKLFLKGDKCKSDKCPFEKKAYIPGQHGLSRRPRPSNYALQLREKQKIKRMYGLYEKQFRTVYITAAGMSGITGTNMMQILEQRLDNVVYRLGFAVSRPQARQIISHGHIEVNGKKVDISSYKVTPGDRISVKQKSKKVTMIHEAMKQIHGEHDLAWLQLDKASMEGVFLEVPERDQMGVDVNEQLVVELYSK
ncbi:MAG: 30S ribosomal protein S4 [Spirochaetota bacterium]|nr:30S ribosomal protein S4 [Spirochaetota bacterium]